VSPGRLTISIIYEDGHPVPAVAEILNKLPQVSVLEEFPHHEDFFLNPPKTAPDSMLVLLNGGASPPEWLGDLSHQFPHTAVLVCSKKMETDFLLRAMQLGVKEFLPFPLSQENVEAALRRMLVFKQRLAGASHTQGKVVAVCGHKGGIGTTTIAINLAVALAEIQPDRCALVDLGRPFPDVGTFLDQKANYSLRDVLINLENLDQSFFQKIMQPFGASLEILHGISDFEEQENLDAQALEKLFNILRGLYKFIVVDLGHVFDELLFRIFQEADLALLVTDLNVPNFINLKKIWPIIREWDPEQQKVKVVVNRNNQDKDLLRELEEILKEPPYAVLPSDYHPLIEAINQGVPLAKVGPRSKLARAVNELARKIIASLTGEEGRTREGQSRRRFWLF
jgi:pilus assembly protein CpaE